MDSIEEAKKMYFDAGCSEYIIRVSDQWEKYRSFHVTREMQEEWTKEYVLGHLKALSDEGRITSFNILSGKSRERSDSFILNKLFEFYLKEKANADLSDERNVLRIVKLGGGVLDAIGPFSLGENTDGKIRMIREVLSTMRTIRDQITISDEEIGRTIRMIINNSETEADYLLSRIDNTSDSKIDEEKGETKETGQIPRQTAEDGSSEKNSSADDPKKSESGIEIKYSDSKSGDKTCFSLIGDLRYLPPGENFTLLMDEEEREIYDLIWYLTLFYRSGALREMFNRIGIWTSHYVFEIDGTEGTLVYDEDYKMICNFAVNRSDQREKLAESLCDLIVKEGRNVTYEDWKALKRKALKRI